MAGKTIRIFLADGIPSGVLTAEIINWTGKAIFAPRSQLVQLGGRSEANRTGIYFLVGNDLEQGNRERVYIGEGDSVFERLKAHDKDSRKDYWTRAAVIISKDENLTKSHVRYLESKLIKETASAGRVILDNGNQPSTESRTLPESDIADMEFFLEQVKLILPVLGFNFLQPVPQTSGVLQTRFVMRDVGTNAIAVEVNDQFIVLKGSTARKETTPSWSSYVSWRDSYVTEGKLIDSPMPGYYEFTEDVPFDSPSSAAAIIAGGSRNGRTSWKLELTGQTYAEYKASQLEQIELEA
jgi:hypothetical protein